jgi:hypothetical protein
VRATEEMEVPAEGFYQRGGMATTDADSRHGTGSIEDRKESGEARGIPLLLLLQTGVLQGDGDTRSGQPGRR